MAPVAEFILMKPGLSVRPTALGHGPPRDARFLGSVTEEADREPTSSRPQPREKDSSPHCFLRGTSMPSYSITTSKNNCSSNLSLAPCSSWIMPPFHKTRKTRELIEESGHELLFLPPHSPDFNPIEKHFANLKKIRTYQPTDTPIDDIVRLYGY